LATQLRDYQIQQGSLDQFIAEWHQHLAPLRRELGFTIPGAWTVEGESRFVWLLTYPGDWDAFEEADQRYFVSPQRAAISPDPARLIEQQAAARLAEVEIG
jgi:hypothetical protein